jgi:hypothetical protein
MRFRKLRIAWSVASGLAALLLIVLWAISYWRTASLLVQFVPQLTAPDKRFLGYESAWFSSDGGRMWFHLNTGDGGHSGPVLQVGMYWHSYPYDQQTHEEDLSESFKQLPLLLRLAGVDFGKYEDNDSDFHWILPHWLAALIFSIIGAIPWLPWCPRFSLRTLLVGTTLVAVVLGVIVWAIR